MSIVFVSGDFYENCFVQGSKDGELFSSRMGMVGFRKITNKNLLQVE
jgi:hypothetical protein